METNNWIITFFKRIFSFLFKPTTKEIDKAVLVDKIAAAEKKETIKGTSRGKNKSNPAWWKTLYDVRDRKSLDLNKQPIGFGNLRPLKPFAHTSKAKLFSMRIDSGAIL